MMLRETATVVSTSGGRAKVAVVRSEACGSCPAKSMCSAASGNTNVLEVRNPSGAGPGARVVIELPPKALVKATALLYLLPALAMVAGATMGWLATGSDPGAMVGTLGGLISATLALYLHGRRVRSSAGPVISEILSPGAVGRGGRTGRVSPLEAPSEGGSDRRQGSVPERKFKALGI